MKNSDSIDFQVPSRGNIRLLKEVERKYDDSMLFPVNLEEKYEKFTLTDIQHAYWIGSSKAYELGNTACHTYFELSGSSINVARLEMAVNELIQRHDMLRAIINRDGTQRILKETPIFRVNVNGNGNVHNENSGDLIDSVRSIMSHRVFDYEKWPLFDIQLSETGEVSVLHFSFDLIVLDAFSIQKLMYELACRYKGKANIWKKLSISFRDWVMHECRETQSIDYKLSSDYWCEKAKHWPGVPQFPLKTQPGSIKKPFFHRREIYMDEKLWSGFKHNAKKHHLTVSSALLCIFTDVIKKWSASDDFLVNLTVFNRLPVHSQINDILGDFTSSIIFEAVNESGPFVCRAQTLQKRLWTDFSHRRVSGVSVLRELPGRGNAPKYVPVVFTSLLGHDMHDHHNVIEETFGKFQYGISQTPQVWLDHQVSERNGELFLTWDYNEALFQDGMVDDMFDAYVDVIGRLADSSEIWGEKHVSFLPVYQQQVMAKANLTESVLPNTCLHDLFLKQAQKYPEKEVLIDGDVVMDYHSLHRIVIGLAQQLYDGGVCQGDNVAIVMAKGWEQVAAVLAINYVGAAYVPIDIHLPESRRRYLLENTYAGAILTQSEFTSTLNINVPVLIVTSEVAPQDNGGIKPFCSPDNLAYIMFTSGSTGAPKGVAITHRSAVNTVLDINRKLDIQADNKVLALSSLSFDLSVYDIYGVLAAGGCIVFPERNGLRDPGHWHMLIERYGITLWNTVPALMGLLTSYLENRADNLPTLRNVLLSGDWIPIDLPRQIAKYAKDACIVSLGGATEASIWSVYYPVKTTNSCLTSIPYGKPLANQTVHVLDRELNACPFWVAGDLYIGGAGLAQGYWRDPEKTAEKFIVHPISRQRLYKTGDIGRYLPDGNIEFLGRGDYQVKIQGFRVELGEVESVLRSCPNVRDAVVVAKGEVGHKKLIAYVVPDNSHENSAPMEERSHDDRKALRQRAIELAARSASENIPFDTGDVANVFSILESMSLNVVKRSLMALGVFSEKGEQRRLSDILQCYGIHNKYEKLVRQWVEVLIKEGCLEEVDGYLVNQEAFSPYGFEQEWQYLEASSLINKEFIQYLKLSFDCQIDLLKGKVSPLELFFPQGSWERALGLYESNPLSQYYNAILTSALCAYIDQAGGNSDIHILEVGAGTGGTTAGVLPEIDGGNVFYTFSDLTTFFTQQAEKRFSNYDFVDYRLFDIDRDLEEQGMEGNRYDVIVAANVLHDAHNIHKALRNLATLLKPGGVLLVREAIENSRTQMVSVGFIEGFSGYQDEREKKNLPLLSTTQWQAALEKAGFLSSSAYPIEKWPFHGFQESVLVAQCPTLGFQLNKDELQAYLRDRLPEYMVPGRYIVLEELPLTFQGKVDRKSLPDSDQRLANESSEKYAAPQTDIQKVIVNIWQDILRIDKVGIDDNFFDVGGDSLYLTMMITELEKRLGIEIPMTELFRFPTIRSFSNHIAEGKSKSGGSPGLQRGELRRNVKRRKKSRKNSGKS